MPVTGGEECAVDRDRQIERRPGHELLAVDVAAATARRDGRMNTRLVRRHPEHAQEGRQSNRPPGRATDARVELPIHPVGRLGERGTPRAGLDLIDPNRERLAGTRTANLDRSRERMPGVELWVTRGHSVVAAATPTRVRHRDPHGVARIDGENRLEVAGEAAVQVAGVERKLVQRH